MDLLLFDPSVCSQVFLAIGSGAKFALSISVPKKTRTRAIASSAPGNDAL